MTQFGRLSLPACLGVPLALVTLYLTLWGNTGPIMYGLVAATVSLAAIGLVRNVRGGLPKGSVALAVVGLGFGVVCLVLVLSLEAKRERTRRAARVARATARLTILANALMAYEKEHGHLPPQATFDKDGKPLLSWRVLVLPYLEREGEAPEGLFKEFRLDEPWDSPNNIKLTEKMPKVFWGFPFSTPYQAVVGKGAAFEGTTGVALTRVLQISEAACL